MPDRSKLLTRLAHGSYIFAGLQALLILMAAAGAETLLTAPGAFLFRKFHLASLYIPGLIVLTGLLIGKGRLPRRTMLTLWLSPFPFLTAAVFLQVASGNNHVLAPRVLMDALGRFPSAVLFLILLSLEIIAIIRIGSLFPEAEDRLFSFADLKDRFRAVLSFLGLTDIEENEASAGGEEPTLEDRPPMAFPTFPEAPEPIAEVLSSFPGAPEKPNQPNSPVTDPVVSDLIRRALRGNPPPSRDKEASPEWKDSRFEADYPDSSPSDTAPLQSAFPPPKDFTPAPGDLQSSSDGVSESIARALKGFSPSPSLQGEFPENPELGGIPVRDEVRKPGDNDIRGSFSSDIEAERQSLDPAFAFLAEDSIPSEDDNFIEEFFDDRADIADSPVDYLSEAKPERPVDSELVRLAESLPEEDRDIAGISGKLDPQGSSPVGVIAGKKSKPRPRKRKIYEVPVKGVLAEYPDADFASIDENSRKAGEVLEQTLKEFKIEAKVTGIRKGPVITLYELLPSPGVKISRIVNLQDNIALRLAASRVRIVAPIPGKHAVGIEVPNKKRAIVSFSSLVESEEFTDIEAGIPVILGKDISGGNQVIDLTKTPHLLIAGATGSGKSVCVNSLIGSILYSKTPQEVKMIMVDPKIVELKLYNDIPHLLTPVITEAKKAIQALQWCLYEMERRYSMLDTQGVRDIKTYNKRVKDRKLATEPLPYIVVLVDEFADLMATSGKELEGIVARLAAMSRAVGIHLVLATQRPSVDVITGLIKANFPSRIAFMVAQKTDSRIIIDAMGAEKLLGRGDMLFTSAWDPFPARMQGAFLAEEEVERMANHVKTLGEPEYIDDEMFFEDEEEEEFQLEAASGDDPMYDKALEIIVSTRKASASYLQRRLKIGYNRAARLVEEMERRGIVGPPNGSKPRDLIHIPERFAIGHGPGDEREPSSA